MMRKLNKRKIIIIGVVVLSIVSVFLLTMNAISAVYNIRLRNYNNRLWNAGYNIRLDKVTESDLEGITNFSFELFSTAEGEDDSYGSIIVAGDWIRITIEHETFVFNIEERKEYLLYEEDQRAYVFAMPEDEHVMNPKEFLFGLNYVFEYPENIMWRLVGTEIIDGNECLVYVGRWRGGSARLYRLADRNIYIRLISYDNDGNEVMMVKLENLRLSGVTEDEARIPEGFTIVEGDIGQLYEFDGID